MALVGHWKLDGNANDSSGNKADGNAYAVTYSGGILGQCGYFDGTNSYISINMTNGIPNTYATFSVWIKPNVMEHKAILTQRADNNGSTYHCRGISLRSDGVVFWSRNS